MENGSLFDPGDPNWGSAVEVFTFPPTGQQIRIIGTADAPLFCHADACKGLDHSNPSVALALVERDDRVQIDVRETDIPNLNRDKIINPVMWFLTEAGFYDLALASKAPGAKAFKRWITHDVLPKLRKTGSYSIVPQQFDPSNLDHVVQLAQIAADQKRQIAARDEKIAELAPMAAQAEQHRAADGLLTFGDLANKLKAWAKRNHPGVKVLHQDLWDFAGEVGLLIRGNTVRKNRATSFAAENDYVREKESEYEDRDGVLHITHTPRLTPAGEGWLWDRATARIAKNGTLRKAIGGAA